MTVFQTRRKILSTVGVGIGLIASPTLAKGRYPPGTIVDYMNYIIYFEFDSAELTQDGLDVAKMFATFAATGETDRVSVTGYTDTAGPSDYNMELSKQRTKIVADKLVELGVRSEKLFVNWKGETEPFLPTADNVKEPLNRRVTIDFSLAD